MPFKKIGSKGLDEHLRLRLLVSEKQRLAEDAENAGLSMSELVRRRYFGRPIVTRSDKAVIRELRRQGGLLKHIHNQSNGAYSDLTANALRSLVTYLDQLSSANPGTTAPAKPQAKK